MKLLQYLCEKFISEEKWNMIYILILSLTLSIFATNVISNITANIIQEIQKNNIDSIYLFYKYFIIITILFFTIFYTYKYFQIIFLVKLPEWIKLQMINILFKINNQNMSNKNFAQFYTYINRTSSNCFITFNDIIGTYIPFFAFSIVVISYFLYKNITLGLIIVIFNIIIYGYLYLNVQHIFDKKLEQENEISKNNNFMLDLLNNADKVIYRGQTTNEIDIFSEKVHNVMTISKDYFTFMNNKLFIANGLLSISVLVFVGYLIDLQLKKKIDTVTFITFFTMILLYRDRTNTIIFSLPDNIEAMGRITNMLKEFDEFINKNESITDILEKIADSKINNINNELKFDKIRFEDVSFQYKGKDTKVFDHLTKEIYLKNKIIGIVGPSGKGKSTIMKLVIRLYEPDSGKIYIDDIDITTLDPDFIREHITYVNQNSRLFDKKVLENIFYGCKEQSSCDQLLKEIMEHSKIQELYKNVDIINGPSGALGEKLSGGQRQVINIISGLINPTEILILDEPTNALDNDLKREILTILQKFRKYKKCIMIITHDHDVYPLFDETIEL